jgi:hypothetical protein
MNVINVAWFYALVAIIGLALLAAAVLVDMWRDGRHALAGSLLAASLLYYSIFLAGYFTVMHGDRPRWEEAAIYLRQMGTGKSESGQGSRVFAYLPRVVAFYLGADPRRPETFNIVQGLPETPPALDGASECWFVVEAKTIPEAYRTWLAE